MVNSRDFFDKAIAVIEEVAQAEHDRIVCCAKMMGDCMLENGIVQLFGINHGLAFSMELGYRAGGLMPFHQFNTKDLAMRGVITEEQLHDPNFDNNIEMAHKMFDLYRIEKEDMFILISNSGSEALIVEVAKIAKENGHKVVAVVSKETVAASTSKHPSGDNLVDVADLVIDNHAKAADALVDVDGTHKMNQVGTITGNIIAQMLTAETYHYLTDANHDCPVLLSANVKGADKHNRALSDKYLGRWNS